MFKSSIQTIDQFKEVLLELPQDSFTEPCEVLSNATIGQHTRHIIELYQCLIKNYDSGKIFYDRRQRDTRIEQDVSFAIEELQKIQHTLERPDKPLTVCYDLNDKVESIRSNYYREVMYNLEHCIHHQALIKVAISMLTNIFLPESFGVAASTIKYRKECAR